MAKLVALVALPLLASVAVNATHFCLYFDGKHSYPNGCWQDSCPSTSEGAKLFADESFYDDEICEWFRDSDPNCSAADGCVEAEHFQLACDRQHDLAVCYGGGKAALDTMLGRDFMMAEVSTGTFANRTRSMELLEDNRKNWPQVKFTLDHVLTPRAGDVMPALHAFGTWGPNNATTDASALPCYMRWESEEDPATNAKSWFIETFVPVSPTSLAVGPTHGDADLTKKLQARMTQFATHYNAKDYTALMRMYAPQLAIAPKAGSPLNADGATDYFKGQPLGTNISVTMHAATASSAGLAAHSFGNMTAGSSNMPFYARWAPQKGDWLIEAHVFTGMAAAEDATPMIVV